MNKTNVWLVNIAMYDSAQKQIWIIQLTYFLYSSNMEWTKDLLQNVTLWHIHNQIHPSRSHSLGGWKIIWKALVYHKYNIESLDWRFTQICVLTVTKRNILLLPPWYVWNNPNEINISCASSITLFVLHCVQPKTRGPQWFQLLAPFRIRRAESNRPNPLRPRPLIQRSCTSHRNKRQA